MSHKENFANCELAGHNPRYFDKDSSICLYCAEFIKNINLTDREVKIVDYYHNNPSKDLWYHDFVENEKGKEIRVLDKKTFKFKGWS